jgi:uncharacterized protein (TIGR00255 family)
MTGFARAEGGHGGHSWTWEAKSVNGRGLDVRCRLPSGFDRLEVTVRGAVQERFARGSFTVALQLKRVEDGGGYRVNRALLDQLIDQHRDLEGRVDPAPPRLDALLAVRGVVEPAEVAESAEQLAALEAADAWTASWASASIASSGCATMPGRSRRPSPRP